jgi:hypothetical protein
MESRSSATAGGELAEAVADHGDARTGPPTEVLFFWLRHPRDQVAITYRDNWAVSVTICNELVTKRRIGT